MALVMSKMCNNQESVDTAKDVMQRIRDEIKEFVSVLFWSPSALLRVKTLCNR
jgi:hypothetical protein